MLIDVLGLDMTGYSPSGKVSVYTDYSDSGLVTYVRKIVTQYTGITYTTDKCGYGCSDHASAYANGFRKSSPVSATRSGTMSDYQQILANRDIKQRQVMSAMK